MLLIIFTQVEQKLQICLINTCATAKRLLWKWQRLACCNSKNNSKSRIVPEDVCVYTIFYARFTLIIFILPEKVLDCAAM